MVWPTLGLRKAKEQNRTCPEVLFQNMWRKITKGNQLTQVHVENGH